MYNKTLVVLLSGKAGAGKTYISNILQSKFEKMGLNSIRSAFAIGIKEIATRYIGWDGIKDEKGRKLLQTLGTEVGRVYDPDCWIKYMLSKLENSSRYPYDVIIVDDWRFPNEYEYFKDDPSFSVVKIRIIPQNTVDYLISGDCKLHKSELSLPEDGEYYEIVYHNNYNSETAELTMTNTANLIDSWQSKYK